MDLPDIPDLRDTSLAARLQHKLDHKTKPLGALGRLEALAQRLGVRVGVLVTDSFGRPWRMGVCGTCIGCAGLVPLADMRGRPDRFGHPLRITQIAVADEIAAAATLAMGEADEGRPIVVVSGVAEEFFASDGPAS